MPRLTYITEVDPASITYLAWAAGLAQGAGNAAAAQALEGMLSRLQMVEMPDDEDGYGELVIADTPPLELVPELDDEAEEVRTPDPAFMPPAPAPPMNRQEDFGAGPPPAGAV